MGRLKLLYPFLFITIPILHVLARNPGGSTLTDAGGLVLAMLVGCAVLYGGAALAMRHGAKRRLVPLMVLNVIIWFYAYPAVQWAYHQARGAPAQTVLIGAVVLALVVATFAGVLWVGRRPALLERVNTFFAMTGLLLLAFIGARLVADELQARSELRASALLKELNRPIAPTDAEPPVQEEPARDVYLIILDEYAGSSVLRERFGFDNTAFEDSLRKLGFTVPRLVRSNYVHTLLSLPSILNFSHLQPLGAELGPKATDPRLPNYLVENNRATAFLKARGYRFVFFPSQWWISTKHNRNADVEFRAWTGFNLAREASRSDLRRAFVSSTPLALLQRGDRYDADHVRRTLGGLEELPAVRAPTFAFAHILNPHYPYVFDAACNQYRTRPNRGWGQGRHKMYLEQIQCLNRLLLGTVTEILQRSSPQPVILLVGDHGTNSLGSSTARSAEAVSPAQARERFGTLGAFYLPEGGDSLFTDSLTLVNLLPRVLNHYFGAGIDLGPNTLYLSVEGDPYRLVPVDPQSLSGR